MGLLSKKKTPNPEELYNACKTNNRAEVTRLIDAKCDPQGHADPFTGDVCLHVCANKNRYELMEPLLKAGAAAAKQNKVTGPCVPSSRRLASSVPSGTLTVAGSVRSSAKPRCIAPRGMARRKASPYCSRTAPRWWRTWRVKPRWTSQRITGKRK